MRDWTEQLEQLEAQLERQNAELDQAFSTLQSLGDNVELAVPQGVLDEIEEACASRETINTPRCGAIRA